MKNKLFSTICLFGAFAGAVIFLLLWGTLSLFGSQNGLRIAAFGGVAAAFVIAIWLFLIIKGEEKRYSGIEKLISEPVALRVNANVSTENVSRNGYLYLTEKRLICYFRDRTPYTKMAFSLSQAQAVRCLTPVSMEIVQGGHVFEIACADLKHLSEKMRAFGWQLTYVEP